MTLKTVARRTLAGALALLAACSPGYLSNVTTAGAGSGPAAESVGAGGASAGLPPPVMEGVMMAAQAGSVYDFTLSDIDGKPMPLTHFRGKVLLLVNTASFCGNTPQYGELQRMYEKYRDQGFEILAFPANNFGQQEPGTNDEIKSFCYTKYSLTFPLFSKISVKGGDKHPLYRYLTEQSPFPGEVEWNFQKYLVDRSGNVVARYHHRTKPLAEEVVRDVERVLGK